MKLVKTASGFKLQITQPEWLRIAANATWSPQSPIDPTAMNGTEGAVPPTPSPMPASPNTAYPKEKGKQAPPKVQPANKMKFDETPVPPSQLLESLFTQVGANDMDRAVWTAVGKKLGWFGRDLKALVDRGTGNYTSFEKVFPILVKNWSPMIANAAKTVEFEKIVSIIASKIASDPVVGDTQNTFKAKTGIDPAARQACRIQVIKTASGAIKLTMPLSEWLLIGQEQGWA